MFNAVFLTVDWRHLWVYYILPLENVASITHWSSGGLTVLWSLAIEEQFYLLWPLLVIFLPRKTLLNVLTAIVIISPVLRLVATPFFPSYLLVGVLTPFRLDTIGLGALLALLYESSEVSDLLKKYSRPIFLAAVAALVIASHFGYDHKSNSLLFNSIGYSLVAIMSAGLMVWSTIEKGWLYTLLTIRPLRYIGKISYTAYLIHLPMILLVQTLGRARGHYTGSRLALASFPLTLLFASISWHLIERPILRWRKLPTDVAKPDFALQSQAIGPLSDRTSSE
jgi:peptidoglycan/LPS O-acetylase OafA/YrhL